MLYADPSPKPAKKRRPRTTQREKAGLGLLKGYTITWFWVGTHDDYERVIGE